MAMPKVIAGIPGVKAGVREALGTEGLWCEFDKAWERLLARKQIGYLK